MELADLSYGVNGVEKPAIIVQDLEELGELIPELIAEYEERSAPFRGDPKRLADLIEGDDKAFFRDDVFRRSVSGSPFPEKMLSLSFEFSVGTNAFEQQLPYGTVNLMYDVDNDDQALPLIEEQDAGLMNSRDDLYNVEIRFFQSVPFMRHGGGWEMGTSHSQYGMLYGTEGLGYWQDRVEFKSKEYMERETRVTWQKISPYRLSIPPEMPVGMQLIFRDIGQSEKSIRYKGIKLRAADIDWGDGEFTMLVRHLGLGRGERPQYTFEKYVKPELVINDDWIE